MGMTAAQQKELAEIRKEREKEIEAEAESEAKYMRRAPRRLRHCEAGERKAA